jgi:hypothetical protein
MKPTLEKKIEKEEIIKDGWRKSYNFGLGEVYEKDGNQLYYCPRTKKILVMYDSNTDTTTKQNANRSEE